MVRSRAALMRTIFPFSLPRYFSKSASLSSGASTASAVNVGEKTQRLHHLRFLNGLFFELVESVQVNGILLRFSWSRLQRFLNWFLRRLLRRLRSDRQYEAQNSNRIQHPLWQECLPRDPAIFRSILTEKRPAGGENQ